MKSTKTKKRKGPVRAKKVVCDGITFQSGLEKFMYVCLRQANIPHEYEGKTYTVFEGFDFPNDSFERQANGKGCLLYTSPSPRDYAASRMPSSA